MNPKKLIAFILAAGIPFLTGVPQARGADVQSQTPGDVVKNIGDVLIYIVPATAFGMTLGAKDPKGTKMFLESGAISMGIVASFKYTVKSRRPNGDPQSFPSGHTAIMVQSSEFLWKRYGWQYGLPAYGLAGFVGYSRAVSKEHYPRDVYAGAVFGFIGPYLITKRFHGGCFELKADSLSNPMLLYVRPF